MKEGLSIDFFKRELLKIFDSCNYHQQYWKSRKPRFIYLFNKTVTNISKIIRMHIAFKNKCTPYLRKTILKKTFKLLLFSATKLENLKQFKVLIKVSIWNKGRLPSLKSFKGQNILLYDTLRAPNKIEYILLSSFIKSQGGFGSTVKRYTKYYIWQKA